TLGIERKQLLHLDHAVAGLGIVLLALTATRLGGLARLGGLGIFRIGAALTLFRFRTTRRLVIIILVVIIAVGLAPARALQLVIIIIVLGIVLLGGSFERPAEFFLLQFLGFLVSDPFLVTFFVGHALILFLHRPEREHCREIILVLLAR